MTGTSGYGLIDSSGNFVAANTATTYQVTNGQVTFKIGASSDASATQTLTTSALSNAPSGVNINYGTLTVNQTAATATQLAITSNVPSLSVNTSGATADLTIQEEDSAGTPVSQGAYMTLTLSGPGSFSPSGSVTSETEYVDGSTMVPVYGEKGVAGNITVTASASGMQSGTITVPAYVNTAPANITLTSKQGTTSSGTPFTLYTVQLVDTNGNPITTGTNADNAITISDNTATVGGTLKYYTVSNGQPTASAEPMSTTLTNGTLQFAVENTTVSSTSPTITVKDTTENFTATAPYTYQVGSPAQVASTNPTLTTGYVEAGHSVTYSVQLEDSNGNPLNTAGQSVVFYFNGTNGAGATLPNGVALTGMSNGYVAQTNSQGVASVTVNVPSAATNASSFQVAAQLQNGTMAAAMGPTETVEPADNFATSMAFGHPSTPSTMTVGTASQTVTGQTVTLDNAVNDQVTTGDQLLVTTSNPSVLALSKYNTGSTTSDTITASSGVATMPTLTGGMAGTATVTVTDLSNPAVPTISETFTVQVGQPSQGTFYLNGQPLGSSNALTVAANTPVALTLYNTDAAGNPVPVTTQEANGDSNGATFALKDTSGTGAFRLTSTGADVTTATIPVGQESVTVYYVNSTAGTYTNDVSASLTSSVVNAANSTVTVPTSVTAGKSMTVSGTVKDVNGNGVGGATVDVLFDGKTGTGTTSSTGTYSVTLTPTKAVSSSPVTVTANGTTISTSSDTTAVTPAVSAAQNIAATETSTGANVTWTAPATGTAASYQVWEINTTTGTKTDIASSVSGSATSYSVNGLTIGDSYEFNVDAVDQYGNVVLGTPSSPAFEYGTLATGAANTAFSANTSSAAGSATFTVTMDKSLPSQTPTLSDFTVKDTTGSITYTVTGVTVSGKTVTITTTIPAGTVAAATDTVVVTGTQGALTDSAGAPSAAFSLSTTN